MRERATYLLPIRHRGGPALDALTAYLHDISAIMPVVVVDGSSPQHFAEARVAWNDSVLHLAPDPALACANGKVHGVLTGLRHVDTPIVVIADDDVRYDIEALRACVAAMSDADVVIPQNWFDPLPWHARWDTARTLINRCWSHDWPGTLVLRCDALGPEGYDGDVLFENLELVRTVRAGGGTVMVRRDVFVRRLPPTFRHFVGQRVRQAYDELARPWRFATCAAIVPAVTALVVRRRPGIIGVMGTGAVVMAEVGRRRDGGRRVFPPSASLLAPAWLMERGLCTWLALAMRIRGGVPYAGRRLSSAATSPSELRRRADRRRAGDRLSPRAASTG